jgi:hypothetical protein
MQRSNARKFALSLESLESRNLQSALSTTAAVVPPVTSTPAVVTSFQNQDMNATHSYHSVAGFFGQ